MSTDEQKSVDDPALTIPSNFHEEDELKQLEDSNDVDKLRALLEEDEIVYRIILCFKDDSSAVLAATSRRILFVDKKFLSSDVITFLYREVAAVVYNDSLVTQHLTIVHSSRTLTVEKVDKEHGARFVQFIERAIGGDYTIEGDGHTFRHNDDMLKLQDVPSLSDEIDEDVIPEATA